MSDGSIARLVRRTRHGVRLGEPRYRFPPADETVARLCALIDASLADGETPVVLAYALGKAQEALYHLLARGYDVAVHGAIARLCGVHLELGHGFPGPGRWTRYRRGELAGRVLLTTPGTRNASMVRSLARRRVIYLTGWALHPAARVMYRGVDEVLPLSDHADVAELERMARESGARKILTVHGSPKFARHLRSIGLDAVHLDERAAADGGLD